MKIQITLHYTYIRVHEVKSDKMKKEITVTNDFEDLPIGESRIFLLIKKERKKKNKFVFRLIIGRATGYLTTATVILNDLTLLLCRYRAKQ